MIWKKLINHKVVNGIQIRTNGYTGKKLEYYHWDNTHKEIEVYDNKLNPIRAISPMTGRDKMKDVSHHKKLKLD